MTPSRRAATALLASAALIVPAVPASAAQVSQPLVGGLFTPLGLAVGSDGTLYVPESFAGRLKAVDKKGVVHTVVQRTDGAAISGVEAEGRGTVSFTVSRVDFADTMNSLGELHRILPNGRERTVADTAAIEQAPPAQGGNPDGSTTYGVVAAPTACVLPPDATYPGDVNPNAYKVAILPDGARIVADAGGNDLLKVTPRGKVSVLSVLPPVEVTLTSGGATALGLPAHCAGATLRLHPVPTDVELGPDGMLYVSSLPGGPEGPEAAALGANGGVFRVDPSTGASQRIAAGFLGAVDLAVSPDGTIYVAELFGGRVSKVVPGAPGQLGHAEKVVDLAGPGAVEWANGMLYATMNAFPPAPVGSVVTITP